MSKYLLPCECGKGVAVDIKQAGQQLACECGKLLEVPTLRGVRELIPKRADWDRSRGMIFAGSLLLFVVGASLCFVGYQGLRTAPNITREDEKESFEMSIDEMSLEETYATWQAVRKHGLGPRGQNIFVNIREFRAGRQSMLTFGIALCVIGALGGIGSAVGIRKTPR